MKKVIVTGGAGFIGSHTVVELINAGYEPIIVDNFSNSDERIVKQLEQLTETSIDVYNVDCKNMQQLSKALILEGPIHGIIHFAAFKAVGESVEFPTKYYDNNVGSLINILKLMPENDVYNIVFSSSCTVYGEPETSVVDENTPRVEAISPYGNTKRICEDMIMDAAKARKKMKAAILRYFNPIGAHPSSMIGELPNGVPNNLVPYITQTAAGKRDELSIFGNDYPTEDGTCIRDYIHVVDLAKAHVDALNWMSKTDENLCEVFNIGTGKGSSVQHLVDTFEKVNDIKINKKVVDRRPGDITAIYANADKAKEVLGWEAKLTMEDALRDAWNWQQYLGNNW